MIGYPQPLSDRGRNIGLGSGRSTATRSLDGSAFLGSATRCWADSRDDATDTVLTLHGGVLAALGSIRSTVISNGDESWTLGLTQPPDTADLFEIMRTTRSLRRLKADPVPNELVRKILEAGVCAPSGGLRTGGASLTVMSSDPKHPASIARGTA